MGDMIWNAPVLLKTGCGSLEKKFIDDEKKEKSDWTTTRAEKRK